MTFYMIGILVGVYLILVVQWYKRRIDEMTHEHLVRIRICYVTAVLVIIYSSVKLIMLV